MSPTAKDQTKQDVAELNNLLIRALENVPASELPTFRDFVNQLAGLIATFSLSGEAAPADWVHGGAGSGESYGSFFQRLALMSATAGRLWTRSGVTGRTQEITESTVPAGSHGPGASELLTASESNVTRVELEMAQRRWSDALRRGRERRVDVFAHVGPLLHPHEAAKRLGVSTVTVKNWRQKGQLLGVRLNNHEYLYPSFQFVESSELSEGGTVPGFAEVLAALPYASSLAKAQFFVTPLPALGGRSPIEVLREVRSARNGLTEPADVSSATFALLRRLAESAGEMGS